MDFRTLVGYESHSDGDWIIIEGEVRVDEANPELSFEFTPSELLEPDSHYQVEVNFRHEGKVFLWDFYTTPEDAR